MRKLEMGGVTERVATQTVDGNEMGKCAFVWPISLAGLLIVGVSANQVQNRIVLAGGQASIALGLFQVGALLVLCGSVLPSLVWLGILHFRQHKRSRLPILAGLVIGMSCCAFALFSGFLTSVG